jgi:hypothetical protein
MPVVDNMQYLTKGQQGKKIKGPPHAPLSLVTGCPAELGAPADAGTWLLSYSLTHRFPVCLYLQQCRHL